MSVDVKESCTVEVIGPRAHMKGTMSMAASKLILTDKYSSGAHTFMRNGRVTTIRTQDGNLMPIEEPYEVLANGGFMRRGEGWTEVYTYHVDRQWWTRRTYDHDNPEHRARLVELHLAGTLG